ncbi:DUF4998 domain-containing protein [Candidatus Symbiothrix dinenymphae]|uniref:DUF4998 domain-containing protein n=1 Tax=Candidatus Symbiothrix dinenymphae TaxID=467085 RepID=UPI0006C03B57|nr:DUF4998 domain-containing protein [Candidatus Symbiothrix dinenymphae]GAP72916.1 hypothetical protein SAMD00024442_5_33 [Candidatus Symbiothrix dinenymphae]
MKKIYISVLAMSLLGFISCDDGMDIHKQYVEDGEIVYAPKVDSMVFRAGKGRILFQGWLINSPNVKTIEVYWNDGVGHRSIPVPASVSDTIVVEDTIPDMGEQSYAFEVQTTDSRGNSSLKTTGSGISYGALFRSTLNQRRVDVGSPVEVGTDIHIKIPWGIAAENQVQTEIRYTKLSGVDTTIAASPVDALTTITDATLGSTFEYRSVFRPEPDAVDTFSLGWESVTIDPVILFDKTNWEVIEWSGQNSGYRATTIIDGIDNNSNSYWHSEWSPAAPPPHWAIIDMKTPKDITQIVTYRASGRVGAKTVQYFVSDDPDPTAATWVQIGNDIVFPNNAVPQMLTTYIPSPDPANRKRYLKIYLPDSNEGVYIQIAEIYVYRSY